MMNPYKTNRMRCISYIGFKLLSRSELSKETFVEEQRLSEMGANTVFSSYL